MPNPSMNLDYPHLARETVARLELPTSDTELLEIAALFGSIVAQSAPLYSSDSEALLT